MSVLGSRYRLFFVGAWLTASMGAVTGQPVDDYRVLRLRNISALEVRVTILPDLRLPGSPSGRQCSLDSRELEEHAANLLRSAGLEVFTARQVLLRARESTRFALEGLSPRRDSPSGRLQPHASEAEHQRHMREAEFFATIPSLNIIADTYPFHSAGATMCAIGIAAHFRAIPAGRPALAANGQPVQATFVLWEQQVQAFAAPVPAIQTHLAERFQLILNRFLGVWRQANQQPR